MSGAAAPIFSLRRRRKRRVWEAGCQPEVEYNFNEMSKQIIFATTRQAKLK